MQTIPAEIPDLLLIKPEVFYDDRGYFFEPYNREELRKAGIEAEFVQDNESRSKKGVLRGLHFQQPPFEQGKLVRVVKGSVLDVAVDIRINSPFYGKYSAVLLSEENKFMFWIPPGFAHGFIALEDNTIFSYKCTGFYNKDSEVSIRWDDPGLSIDWKYPKPMFNEKDKRGIFFKDFTSPFVYTG